MDRLIRGAAAAGLAGAAACGAAAVTVPEAFFPAYLVALLFWTGISAGSLAVLMLHLLVGGTWGLLVRRPQEAAAGALPILALFFLPLLGGLETLYPWSRPEVVGGDELVRHRTPYLNAPFFVARAGTYFGVWAVLAIALRRGSLALDRTPDPAAARRLRFLSGPGLIAYGLAVTFMAVDWVMSLEAHWFSTIFGMIFMAGQGLSGLCAGVLAAALLARREPMAGALTPGRLNDLGNLVLTFVLLWAYTSFAQYLIIWSGNLPEEIDWYLHRSAPGWRAFAAVLATVHFAAPFFLLLSKRVKRSRRAMMILAGGLLGARLGDLFWQVIPSAGAAGPHLAWTLPAALVGIGGFWLAAATALLRRAPLLPVHAPGTERLFASEEGAHG
jgi:hypothetical protein